MGICIVVMRRGWGYGEDDFDRSNFSLVKKPIATKRNRQLLHSWVCFKKLYNLAGIVNSAHIDLPLFLLAELFESF